jgi:subtilisin family serine protease
MCNHLNLLNRFYFVLLIMGMLLSLGVPQPVTAAAPTPPITIIDGGKILSGPAEDPPSKIEPQVLSEIQASGQTDFFVWMVSKTDLSPSNQLDSQEAKGKYVFSTLEEGARTSQAGVTALLEKAGVKFESYYIVDRVLVRGGSLSLALELAARSDVEQLTANHTFQLDPMEMQTTEAGQLLGVGSNLSFIKADQVWAMGYTGAGVVLADQDTGMQWNHPAIINHYRGWNGTTADHNYNWWDATGTYPTAPNDGNGHGTHTSGTMVGDDGAGNQIGVAPGAKLIHCKSYTDAGSANDANVLTCFQFFLAPWDLNHLNPNSAKAPNAINNSWGWGGGNHTTFVAAINALQSAGILVEASAGNDGPACQTLGSPGDYDNILTTGSIDYSGYAFPGSISSYSSRGPSKITPASYMPDVMAPGNTIRSSLPGNTYGIMSGTSMAGPHVTALVALFWQAVPSLKGHVPETIAAIKSHAIPLSGQNGSNCGGNYTTGPNDDWGMGTVDAKALITAYTVGTLSGTVTAAGSGTPIAGVTIIAGTKTTTTGAAGSYSLGLDVGIYTVTVQKSGYGTQNVGGVIISPGATTTKNFSLNPAGPVTVTGTVRDGTPGGHTYPLYARIVFSAPSMPTMATFTNSFDGTYTANLQPDTLWTATITPTLPGYLEATVPFTPTSNPFVQDFSAQAELTNCSAPGYKSVTVFNEGFDGMTAPALPSNWSVWKIGTGSTANWATASSSSHPTGISPVSSPNMAVFNSYSATNTHQAMLYTNTPIPVTSVTTATLGFWMYHDTGYSSSNDLIQPAISINGATFYLTGDSFARYSATAGWVYHQVDISGYVGPLKPSIYLGLLGTSGYGNDIHIDNVSISSCQAQAGGIVAGYVRSAPSGLPVISATVSSSARPSELTFSVDKGLDPNQADGFYQFFTSGTGAQDIAASAIRHLAVVRTANVVNNGIVHLDLSPTSASTGALPNPVTVNLKVGATTTVPLIIQNTGSMDAAFTIQPAASALTSGSTLSGPFPYQEERSTNPMDTMGTQSGGAATKMPYVETNPNWDGATLGGGPRLYGVVAAFPGTAGYRFATASCNGKTFYVIGGQTGSTAVAEVWMYDPATNTWAAKAPLPVAAANMRAACIDGNIYTAGGYKTGAWNNSFNIYDTLANSWATPTTQPVTGGPMLVAYNGLLYSFGGSSASGFLKQTRVYNPATGLWSTLTDMPTAAAYSGALVYKNLIFIIGGADTADVQVYNPASNTWDNSGPDLPGPRMDPVVGWYGPDQIVLLNGGGNGGNYWTPYPDGLTLNAAAWPSGSWVQIPTTILEPQVASASACVSNRLWSMAGTTGTGEDHISQFYDAGLMCNHTYPSVPWLTAAPASSTSPAGGTRTLTLGFNANVASYNNPGVYHAILKFNSDAPYVMPDIPVTMVVVQTVFLPLIIR